MFYIVNRIGPQILMSSRSDNFINATLALLELVKHYVKLGYHTAVTPGNFGINILSPVYNAGVVDFITTHILEVIRVDYFIIVEFPSGNAEHFKIGVSTKHDADFYNTLDFGIYRKEHYRTTLTTLMKKYKNWGVLIR